MIRRTLRAAALTLLVLSPAVARADDAREQSKVAFRRGVDQALAGDYTSARESFKEAYRLFPHPSILLNLGIARAKTAEYLDAEQDLIHFLADDGGAPEREVESARAELAEVRKHLGTFRLRVEPGGAVARVDSRAVALIPGKAVDVRTTVGPHALHVEAEGHEPVDRTVSVDASNVANVAIALRPLAPGAPHDAVAAADRAPLGVALIGGAVVLAGAGLASGLHAKSLADDYNTPNSGSFQDASTKSSGLLFRTLADVAFGSALVLGGVGVYFIVLSPHASAAPAPQARVVVGPAFSGVVGSF